MKHLVSLALCGAALCCALAPTRSTAQTFNFGSVSNFSSLPIIPPIKCPPTPAGQNSPCVTLQQDVDSYNLFATVTNQAQAYRMQYTMYANSLPQTLPANTAQIQQLITTVENGDAATRTLQNPAVVGTPSATLYAQQQSAINQNMQESISAELQQMDLLTAQEAAETDSVGQVKIAAAAAASPAQVEQMNVQLLSTIYDTSVRKETLDRQNARIQAQAILDGMARNNAADTANTTSLKTLNTIANPALPNPPGN